ncbi:MAG TPA: type III PLP-dependent enzyme [candidate division Zixibacteria bacterium]|nr:type III PLP-dependent enzyme [candidate division Zixibacteria bacterium]
MTHYLSLKAVRERLPVDGCPESIDELFRDTTLATPSLIMDPKEIGRNYRALKAALPRVDIHYAIKPNNHQVLIDEIYRLGGNYDVCSMGEINQVLKTGINPATLIHSHPIKSRQEFDRAVAAGIETFVVDNIEEVRKFSRYTDKKLRVLIRFRIHTNTTAVVNLQYKFGCLPEDVLPLAQQIRQSGHDFYGLCFHIGSQCIFAENYLLAIQTAHDLIHTLDLAGFDTRLLDIGGGFPVPYAEPVPPIDEFCTPINQALENHIRPGIRIVCEPGRFIAATTTTLVTSILGKAERDGKLWYYLDDGLYSTFSGIVFDHCQYPVVTAREGDERLSVLAGPTCDSFDVMYDGLMIPEHEVGERIVFLATGAYCAVSGSNFNALKRPEYKLMEL